MVKTYEDDERKYNDDNDDENETDELDELDERKKRKDKEFLKNYLKSYDPNLINNKEARLTEQYSFLGPGYYNIPKKKDQGPSFTIPLGSSKLG